MFETIKQFISNNFLIIFFAIVVFIIIYKLKFLKEFFNYGSSYSSYNSDYNSNSCSMCKSQVCDPTNPTLLCKYCQKNC
jgi:hypothetical protein